MGRNPNGKGGGSERGEISLYKKIYCKKLIKHMAQGFSFSSFGAEVDCCAKTLHNWANEFPDFMDAKRIGKEKAKLFYEKLARMKMIGKKFKDKNGDIIDPKRSDTAMIIFSLCFFIFYIGS